MERVINGCQKARHVAPIAVPIFCSQYVTSNRNTLHFMIISVASESSGRESYGELASVEINQAFIVSNAVVCINVGIHRHCI